MAIFFKQIYWYFDFDKNKIWSIHPRNKMLNVKLSINYSKLKIVYLIIIL